MNAYWIDAGKIQYDHDYETDYYEDEEACGVYLAETRGKAKVKFLQEWSMLEFTDPMRIRLLAKNMSDTKNEIDLINKFSLWILVDDIVKKEGYFKA